MAAVALLLPSIALFTTSTAADAVALRLLLQMEKMPGRVLTEPEFEALPEHARAGLAAQMADFLGELQSLRDWPAVGSFYPAGPDDGRGGGGEVRVGPYFDGGKGPFASAAEMQIAGLRAAVAASRCKPALASLAAAFAGPVEQLAEQLAAHPELLPVRRRPLLPAAGTRRSCT